MPKKPVKVYLTTPQREILAKVAQLDETSRSAVLREAFRRYAFERIVTSTHPDAEAGMNEQ